MDLTLRSEAVATRDELSTTVNANIASMLGRFRRRISHASVTVRSRDDANGRTRHTCSLRLRMRDAREVVVETLQPAWDAAVASAFRQAHRTLMSGRRVDRAFHRASAAA